MTDAAFLSREYNNRQLFPDHAQHFARWAEGSARARGTMTCFLDRPYGPSPAETLDIFPARKGDGSALVFIHGGYWRSLDKKDFSYLAPAWVDGYLTGHDRGVAEGRQAGYADYDRQLVDGLAGMLAGDPSVTDYHDGVRRHERMADAKTRRNTIRDRDLSPDNADRPDSRPDQATVAAFIDGRAEDPVTVRTSAASQHDDGWEL